MGRTRTHMIGANTFDRRVKRGWFAETLVVFGILAFAYFAITLQPQRAEPVLDFAPAHTIG